MAWDLVKHRDNFTLGLQCRNIIERSSTESQGPFGVRQAIRQISSCKGGLEHTMDSSGLREAELTDNISTQWSRVLGKYRLGNGTSVQCIVWISVGCLFNAAATASDGTESCEYESWVSEWVVVRSAGNPQVNSCHDVLAQFTGLNAK
jgi:hypothetical protein